MYIEIKAALKSNLMIGGKTLNNNFRESKPYIPGSVLRAAYARAILERCSYKHENDWLDFKDLDDCKNCRYQGLCRAFSRIAFPALYPSGGSPYPATARESKYSGGGVQTAVDILRGRLKTEAKLAGESEWVQAGGIQKDGQRLEMLYTLITRSAVDYKRHSAKQGALYAQNAIMGILQPDGGIGQAVFSGMIEVEDGLEQELEAITYLRIGADISNGMGYCDMDYHAAEAPDTLEELEERVRQLNAGFGGSDLYISIDLLTDAYLCQEEIISKMQLQGSMPSAVEDAAFCAFLEQEIHLPACFHLIKAYKSQELLRGYHTGRGSEADMRRKGRLAVKAGSVFVYRVGRSDYQAEALWDIEKNGIGLHREHGFGKIRICDSFHIQYDALKGERRYG